MKKHSEEPAAINFSQLLWVEIVFHSVNSKVCGNKIDRYLNLNNLIWTKKYLDILKGKYHITMEHKKYKWQLISHKKYSSIQTARKVLQLITMMTSRLRLPLGEGRKSVVWEKTEQ